MAESISHLIEQLDDEDADVSVGALDNLVQQGKAATPALVKALKSKNEKVRILAAEGLEALADPASADDLFAALKDSNGEVRAHAASGLTSMDDPRAIDALIQTIDDFEDVLHFPQTLSTYNLMAYGQKALPSVAPLLKAPNPVTRMRAKEIIKSVVLQTPGKEGGQEKVEQLLESYDPEAPADKRDPIAEQLANWIQHQTRK